MLWNSPSTAAAIELEVVAGAGGRVLRAQYKPMTQLANSPLFAASRGARAGDEADAEDVGADIDLQNGQDFTFQLDVQSVGLSLVAERPQRREFLSMYIEGVHGHYSSHQDHYDQTTGKKLIEPITTTSMDLKIMDVQVDNYSEVSECGR